MDELEIFSISEKPFTLDLFFDFIPSFILKLFIIFSASKYLENNFQHIFNTILEARTPLVKLILNICEVLGLSKITS